MSNTQGNPSLGVPIGIQIVTRVPLSSGRGSTYPRGAVGVLVGAPTGQNDVYVVRFADGIELPLCQEDFEVRKVFQRHGIGQAESKDGDADLFKYVIFRCVVGSRAYGLDHPGSDVDRRGIYLPPADLHWSLHGAPEQLENAATEECYWELQKFLNLALKANPNILECLYTPLVETATPLALELLEMRSVFLSQLIYQTYNGYVISEFKKLEQSLVRKGTVRWKHAMHMMRLLLSGIAALRQGVVPVRVEEHRHQLLAIGEGYVGWGELRGWRLNLHREFDTALSSTLLPERPDYERVNAFLIRARQNAFKGDTGTWA